MRGRDCGKRRSRKVGGRGEGIQGERDRITGRGEEEKGREREREVEDEVRRKAGREEGEEEQCPSLPTSPPHPTPNHPPKCPEATDTPACPPQ